MLPAVFHKNKINFFHKSYNQINMMIKKGIEENKNILHDMIVEIKRKKKTRKKRKNN